MIKFKDILFYIIMLMALIITIITFPSCRTIEYVPVHTSDTVLVNNYIRDSIKEKDSVYVYRNSDTIYIYREKLAYKDRLVHDTVIHTKYVEKPVEVTKTQYIEKKMKWWQKSLMALGCLSILLIIIKIFKYE